MELRWPVVLLICAMAAVTLLPRLAPLIALPRLRPPAWLHEWLTQVPLAVLAALVVVELVVFDRGAGDLAIVLVAMVPVAVLAAWRGSFVPSVVVGVAVVAVARLLGG